MPPRLPGSLAVDDVALQLIDLALEEDRGPGDWTTRWTVPARTRAQATIIAKADGVIAGVPPACAVFLRLEPRIQIDVIAGDGDRVRAGEPVLRVRGPARAILTGERVALNFLQRLSGVATLTRQFVDAVEGTGARILDTRKTTPGWRALEKAAVRAGGGVNHRAGLYDMVLIKENHKAIAGGLAEAVKRVREHNTRDLPVTVEVHSPDELEAALTAGVDRLLFDNFDTATIARMVRRTRELETRPLIEASGNMSLQRVPEVAAAGVDFISVGALTHSAPAFDLSLLVEVS
ncbi:MAG TPA: carboxylating nicotinate-nucleotide diphosphorylase [Longimicrobiales bacterium]|nr:carboxylating nicotinate-nucleotide diphosphorylase [Longimicrobiales bacterium]